MDIEEYAKKHRHLLFDQIPEEVEFIIKKNDVTKIIDIGCGNGLLLYSLFKRSLLRESGEIWGIDLSEERLKNIKEISQEIVVVKSDAQTLEGVPDDHFDMIVSMQVIEHVADDKKMIESICRVSKKGCFIYIDTVFKKKWAWYFYKNQSGKRALDPTHVREYERENDLFDKISRTDFNILFSKKQLVKYSLINFIVKALKIKNGKFLDGKIFRILRKIQIPVPGYYIWKILLIRK
jgi:ubiquinone/menaquinone biosynthesis C-methylase UbiE